MVYSTLAIDVAGYETPASAPYGAADRDAVQGVRPLRAGPDFRTRDALANIHPESRDGFWAWLPRSLVELIDQFNSSGRIATTHTGVTHKNPTPASLHTAIIVSPAGEGSHWLYLSMVEASCEQFVQVFAGMSASIQEGGMVTVGPIEIIWDAGGSATPTYGMEFGILGSGTTLVPKMSLPVALFYS